MPDAAHTPPRVLLAEEGMRSHSGHWTAYNCCIAQAFRDAGWDAQLAGHAEAAPALRAAGVSPVFRESRWDVSWDALPPLRRRMRNLRHNLLLAADMGRYLRDVQPFDLVFAGNVTIAHALGWWRVARAHPGKVRRLVLMFVQDAGFYPAGSGEPVFPSQAKLLRVFLRLFGPLVRRGRVFLTAETDVTRRQYELLTGLPVHLLTHPVTLPDGASTRSEPPLLVAPGFARHEKGADILQEAWLRFRSRHPDLPARLVLQWGNDFTLPDGRVERPRLEGLPDVNYIRGTLDEAAHAALLRSASAAILPYRRSSYYSRLSRVTIEAMQAGLPILHTADTWLARSIAELGVGPAVPDEDPAALAAALPDFIRGLPALLDAAARRAPHAQAAYSPAGFVRRLIEIALPKP